MSILLADTSFAASQAHWTYSGIYQQAHGPDLMAASSSPSNNARPLLLTVYMELFRCELVICTLYALYVMLYALRAVMPQLQYCMWFTVNNCRQFTVPCLLVGAYIYFAMWTTTAVVSLTHLFLYFFSIDCCYNCFSDSCVIVVIVCVYSMFFSLLFFSGLLRRTVACK